MVPKACGSKDNGRGDCIYPAKTNDDYQKSLIEQNNMLQAIMENMRMEIWKENGTYRESIKDVNAVVYTNHTWMKKYGTFPFNYDSESENKFLFVKPGETLENEWYIDKNGEFKPGIITKKPKLLEKDNVIKQQDRLSIYR